MPGESSSETGNPYGRMHVTEPVRATIPVQNGARLSWDRSIEATEIRRVRVGFDRNFLHFVPEANGRGAQS